MIEREYPVPYNEQLADKIRTALKKKRNMTEKKMFGGICFLNNGNMVCGVEKEFLMLRVGPDNYEKVLTMKHTAKMDFTGRPLTGFVYVKPEGLKRSDSIKKWVDISLKFAKTLPQK